MFYLSSLFKWDIPFISEIRGQFYEQKLDIKRRMSGLSDAMEFYYFCNSWRLLFSGCGISSLTTTHFIEREIRSVLDIRGVYNSLAYFSATTSYVEVYLDIEGPMWHGFLGAGNITCGGLHPIVSPWVTDKIRLWMKDLLGEKRLANLSEEKSPDILSPEAFIENDMCRAVKHTWVAH